MTKTKESIFSPDLMEISDHAFSDEQACMDFLLPKTEIFSVKADDIHSRAERYVKAIRENKADIGIENFLQQYRLGTKEGITIMCLAEALLRIPDSHTANALIYDKLHSSDWEQHLGKSQSLFVNASTWGMMLTGKITGLGDMPSDGVGGVIGKLVSRMGEPIIREALKHAMHIISEQFVIGNTIEAAIKKAEEYEEKGYLLSYDMLGEGARTGTQAQIYYQSYLNAIDAVSKTTQKNQSLFEKPSISVKLSALHPKYYLLHFHSVMEELMPRLKTIIKKAVDNELCVSIDAEETYRLDISIAIFQELLADKDFNDYDGLGFVLQAYQKRAFHVIEHLGTLAKKNKRRIPIRLVKGAYWDQEVKRTQDMGLPDYPVFTRKSHTDVSYLACAAQITEYDDYFYPQFATHNALTVSSILEVLGGKMRFEFQRLYGMGETFYEQLVEKIPCRIYAPVGEHKELLPYLIRRLLENGANTSFINLLLDHDQPINQILADPISKAIRNDGYSNPDTPLPLEMYPDRRNSPGFDLGNMVHLNKLDNVVKEFSDHKWECSPIINGKDVGVKKHDVFCPFDKNRNIGAVGFCNAYNAGLALTSADNAFHKWSRTSVVERFVAIDKAASLLEKNMNEAIALCVYEAGKTVKDAIAEVREAIDYCRYYAAIARKNFEIPKAMSGPTGESNMLSLHGRGTFVCISPWNFPLAIFTGQIVAALLAGNTVVAKPAQQTSLIAGFMVKLLHEAGVPGNVLHLLPGTGEELGPVFINDLRVKGVAFTGSTETARKINISLANREGPIIPFIAETGGQNAMVVDSSALPEQALDDIITSAFESAGQRCSSLRVLYVQEFVADKYESLLSGALEQLKIGPTNDLTSDIGPVIDEKAKKSLLAHINNMSGSAKLVAKSKIDLDSDKNGHYVAPHIFEIKSITELSKEVFGPILHIVRYKSGEIERVIEEINSTGYGLTFGIHSRIEHKIEEIGVAIKAGNIYVNRSMIGAAVGVQPFGGQGLSGTGPKAGGPNYLMRFATERTVSVNTAAIGGNISLLS